MIKNNDHGKDDDHNFNKDEESPRGADDEEDEVDTIMHGHGLAIDCLSPTVKNDKQRFFLRLGFNYGREATVRLRIDLPGL